MIQNKEIYNKYKDIIDENNKPQWRSRPDEELVFFQILLKHNPALGFRYIYNEVVSHSYQIQWIPTYFWLKNIQILENEIKNKDYDALIILNELYGLLERNSNGFEKYNKELTNKIRDLHSITRGMEHTFRQYKFKIYNNTRRLYFIDSDLIPDSIKEEIFLLYEHRILRSELDIDEFQVLIKFDFFLKYILENDILPTSNILIEHIENLPISTNPQIFENIIFYCLNNKKSISYSKVLTHFLFKKSDINLIKNFNKLISEYDKKVFSDKYYFNEFKKYIFNSGISIPDFLEEIAYKYILKFDITKKLKIINDHFSKFYFLFLYNKYPEFSLKIEKELVKRKKVDKFVNEIIDTFKLIHHRNRLYENDFKLIEFDKLKLEVPKIKLSTKIISELLRIVFSQKYLPGITHLLNKGYMTKKNINIAQKLIEEELKLGDPVAMECLKNLILDKNHTEKMLNILIYHAGWGSDHAAEVIYNLLYTSYGGKRELNEEVEKEISNFLFNHLNLKNIKESGQINERFILFKKIYPRFFYEKHCRGFNSLSESSKFKIFTALINNRKFRNSIDAQRKIFIGLNEARSFGNVLLQSLDIIISKENVGSNQLSNYLTKVLRITKTLTYFPSFKNKLSEIKPNMEKCKDLEETYNFLYKTFINCTKTDYQFLSPQELEELAKDDLFEKAIRLENHYSKHNMDHRNIYLEGLKIFLKSPSHHSDFRYKDLNILLEKYEETTNLNKTLISKWIKTMKYVRYPESTNDIDVKTIINRINHIKFSLTGKRTTNKKFESIFSLLEKLEPILYKLNSKDIQKRNEVVKELRKIKIQLNKSKEIHLINIIDSILIDITSVSSNQFLLTDEFNFKDVHDIGERWGSCQSWSSSYSQNIGLVATINDGTKKYIILKDKVTGVWTSRGIIHLALRGNEFVLVLDNYDYSKNKDLIKFIQEFAINKAKYLKIPFIDAKKCSQEERNNLTIFGKCQYFYSDNGLKSSGMSLKPQKIVDNL